MTPNELLDDWIDDWIRGGYENSDIGRGEYCILRAVLHDKRRKRK